MLCVFGTNSTAENIPGKKDKSVYFFQPEIMLGKTLPANSNFPQTTMQNLYSLSFAKQVLRRNQNWPVYFNFPAIGVAISKTTFGHDDKLGHAYTILPFIILNTSKQLKRSLNFKIGLGASYFTEQFHKYDNPDNKAIGSQITWTFQSSVDYSLIMTRNFSLHAGLAFVHHSNGHTQLPNLGLNSFLFTLSSKVYLTPLDEDVMNDLDKPKPIKSKRFFYTIRTGIGMHEFGGPGTAYERLKKAVYTFSAGGGVIYKQVLKLSGGLAYRFYHHYYNYIVDTKKSSYVDKPVYNSSNLYIYMGCELLLGHVGLDSEIGVNLFKPFYSEHFRLWEDDGEMTYWLKSTFVSRLGLKLYAISTAKSPKNNFFVGAHINANMGQADFSEISFGFVHLIGKKDKVSYPRGN